MGQRNSTNTWERIGRIRYNAVADGRVEIAHFLNVLLLYMEKNATVDQLEAERDRLLEQTSLISFNTLIHTLRLPKKIEKILVV